MSLRVNLHREVPGFTLDVRWSLGDEIGALFGYSGSGKSMSIRLIAGLDDPDAGSVYFDDEPLYEHCSGRNVPPQERGFGYMSQSGCLFPHLTLEDNIAFGLNKLPKRERADRAAEMVRAFHLEGLEQRYPRGLSGGQAQRVALARALAPRPRALLLDEPFSHLDLPLRIELWGILHEVRESYSIPVVVVTHDPLEARTMADRLIVYRDGRVLASGAPEEVLREGASPEFATLRTGWGSRRLGVA